MPSSRRSRRRPYGQGHVPLDEGRLRGMTRTERGPGGEEYAVREVAGSEKSYRCPGCDQVVPPGLAHVVAWPTEHLLGTRAGLDERRHWHTSCWRAKRRPAR
ncbi:hypothetical protein [Georgenia alba]|uniref:ATP/GTP-binding protein n=1 Tax=Georgenia alba TaxID=2233858 RepID=A0ABW2Q9V1_9MICO